MKSLLRSTKIPVACRLTILLLCGLLGSLPLHAAGHTLSLSGGWVRLLPGSLPAGGYFVLHNDGDRPLKLTGAAGRDYGQVMLHRSVESNGQSQMRQVDSVTLPAHGTLRFAPGGYHLMLMQPKTPLKVGNKVAITLRFSDGETLTAPFALRPAGASGP